MERRPTPASAFANCGDLVGISAEPANVVFDPFHCCALVVEAVVRFVSCLAQLFGGHEAWRSKSVARMSQNVS
jgi:hypothetical protein